MNQTEKEPSGLRKVAAQEGLPTDEVMERLTPQEIKTEELKKIAEEEADRQYTEYLDQQSSYYDYYDDPFDDPYDPYAGLPPLDDPNYDPWWDDYP